MVKVALAPDRDRAWARVENLLGQCGVVSMSVRGLARAPDLHATGCSWINLVECFFSIITRQAIRRGLCQAQPLGLISPDECLGSMLRRAAL
jgi:hypothetical protein